MKQHNKRVKKTVAAIITVMNEEQTLPQVLEQVVRMGCDQIIIVVNGCTDSTLNKAAICNQASIVYYPDPLGYDVGRAVGARMTNADTVLFLDGDIIVHHDELRPFLQAVDRGMDVALNNIFPYVDTFKHRDAVSIMKEFLNRTMGRDDLTINSMTAVPHALSRRALNTIGTTRLAVPPLAQAVAIQHGLRVGTAGSVDVIARNRRRESNVGAGNPVAQMIIGDHWEAFAYLMDQQGTRLKYTDRIRNREVLHL